MPVFIRFLNWLTGSRLRVFAIADWITSVVVTTIIRLPLFSSTSLSMTLETLLLKSSRDSPPSGFCIIASGPNSSKTSEYDLPLHSPWFLAGRSMEVISFLNNLAII